MSLVIKIVKRGTKQLESKVREDGTKSKMLEMKSFEEIFFC